jgi:hypothetical protein
MPSLADIRQQYPQYADMSDDALAGALHAKFYADMPADQFRQKIGMQPPAQQQAPRMEPGSESDFLAAGGGAGLRMAEGQAQIGAAGVASIPGSIANAGIDLVSRATGYGPNKPIPNVPVGQAGQEAGQATFGPSAQAVSNAASAVDRRLGDSTAANVLRDVSRNAAAVGGDVLTLLPGAAAASRGVRVIEDTAPLWARAGYKSADEALSAAAGFRNGRGQGLAMNLAGSDARKALTNNNLDVGNVIARHAAGVPEFLEDGKTATPLTYEELDKALKPMEDVYRRVASGVPNGDAVLQRLSTARHDGFKALQSDNPDVIAKGRALLKEADGIEDFLQRQIQPGSGTTLEQFQAARKAIAQNRAVYDALQGHDLDLAALGRMYQNAPDKFSGGLKIAGKFATDNRLVVGSRMDSTGDVYLRAKEAKASLSNPLSWPGAVASTTGMPQAALRRGMLGDDGVNYARHMFPGRGPNAFAPDFANAQGALDLPGNSVMQGPYGPSVGPMPSAPQPRIPAPPLENTQGQAFESNQPDLFGKNPPRLRAPRKPAPTPPPPASQTPPAWN